MGSFLKQLGQRIGNDEVTGLSAQLAYFLLLSLFPFIIFLVSLIAFLPVSQQDIMNTLSTFAPESTMDLLEENITGLVNERNGGLLSIGILATLWSASNGVNAIIRALNKAYDVNEDRSFIVARGVAVVLTIAMVLVIAVAFLLPIFGKSIGIYIFSFFGLDDGFLTVWGALRWVISFVIFFIVLLALYVLAPSKKISIKESMVGAAFAAIGWMIASLLFSFYVDNFGNYSATYGSLGAVIVLMIWFYLSGIIIITGGEINAMLDERKKNKAAA
ncbi:YihY/virulence factor BrkB family protein [Terribacillus saccharophilus]|uniref:YihY/virulence factor BrkB family protein n=1 Tax=Terribacillus saccharophilus TaxID=361277 RepID=UPI002989A9B3|nr:YihY/virulence factor BrkB family protein [Terribacillus saccharophilus]MCM3226211.1 YihY/virulence factor BrkB family protein [Terribacillus saccharophilus]